MQRSRRALVTAFNRLILEAGYDAITPAMIVATAGVGRSTLYEHYAGKAGLLRDSLTPVLTPLADAATGRPSPTLIDALRHIRGQRRLGRRLLEGRAGLIVRERLAGLLEDRLRNGAALGGIPLAVQAIGVAAAQLAMLEAWLSGRHACTAEQLAAALTGGRSPIA